ncbi:MAG: ABC transporter ATP-binding protein/permease [Chloroflexota bacterium]|nr:ABC transporter ATP-binding protein/permease [Chloroflexota bacterium]
MMGPRGMFDSEARKARSVRLTLGRFGRYFRPFWGWLLVAAVLLGLNAWVQVITPELTGQAVDCYLTPAVVDAAPGTGGAGVSAAQRNCWYDTLPADATAAARSQGLLRLVLVLVGLFVLGAICGGIMFFLMGWTGQRVLRRLQVEVFHQLHRMDLSFYAKNETGDLMSRITNDTSTIQQAIGFALVQVLSGALILVWIAYNMLRANFIYGLISLAVVPLMIVTTLWFSSQARKAFRITRQKIGDVNAELEEGISGVREVQAFSREDANIEAFRQSNAANRDANIKAVAYTSALMPTLEAFGYLALALVAGVGGIYLLRGQTLGGSAVSLGLIITFIGYSQRFNQPVQQISVLWTNIQSAIAGAERIFDLLDEVPSIQEKRNAKPLPLIAGRVEFKNVRAEYDSDSPVLQGIDLIAEPGQTIAIVGPTGAGKTTLVNLLPRFYDVTGGSVTIDGIDVRDVTLPSLRRQIGIVLQDSFLFSDTVMNNIRFGRPEASDEEVVEAAKLARAHDFIEHLGEGYQTVLGERGGGLSQGQRQLLSIARAALAQPRILILDEATSSVDTRTERQIQAALEQLLAGRTSFVIAHRLSTIRNADQVLVLVQGEIVERGRHEALLAKRGFYYDLYMSQFKRQESVAVHVNGHAPVPVTA